MTGFVETMVQWAAARALRWREERGATTVENVLWIAGLAAIITALLVGLKAYVDGKLGSLS